MQTINVALIGQGFMGRSHSNAWGQVAKFFQPPTKPVMHSVFGQPEENPRAFADNWGWQNASTDWQSLVKSPDVGLSSDRSWSPQSLPRFRRVVGGSWRRPPARNPRR